MDPRAVARQLIDMAAEVESIEIEFEPLPITESQIRCIAEEFVAHQRVHALAKEMLCNLDEALARTKWERHVPAVPKSQQYRWTFGTAVTLRGVSRPIHGGFLQPMQRIPILDRVPERVAQYIIAIDEGVDYLENEAHSGVGLHYHYLNWRKDRSDVVLCWDTRWIAPDHPTKLPAQRGLFVEKHAEKGKPFKAKPGLWGPSKRKTMYAVCSADLMKRQIEQYRCAANNSAPVHPPGATLTPHPSSVANIVKAATKSSRLGRKRKR